MAQFSPYAPPKSPLLALDARGELSGPMESIFTGRRLLMVSLAIMAFGFAVLQALSYAGSLIFTAPQAYFAISISSFFSFFALGPIVAIVGAFRIAGALGHSSLVSFIVACSMVVPALNIVVIGWLALTNRPRMSHRAVRPH